MADKIDQLKIPDSSGTVQSYDIDLPPDATPSISSLTATSIYITELSVPDGNGWDNGSSGQVLKSDGTNVYWGTDDNTTYLAASTSALGLIKVGAVSGSAITAAAGSTDGRFYAVQIDSNGKAYVNIPWTDTTYSTTDFLAAGTKYAGAATAGGAADSANALTTGDTGSATQPVYFDDGVPVACTYSLNKTVPSDAVFTDSHEPAAFIKTAVRTGTDGENGAKLTLTLQNDTTVEFTNANTWPGAYVTGASASGNTLTLSLNTGDPVVFSPSWSDAYQGTVTQIAAGTGLSTDQTSSAAITGSGTISLNAATTSTIGGIIVGDTSTTLNPTYQTNTNDNRYYKVKTDKNGLAYVNVPWTDTDSDHNWDGNYVDNAYIGALTVQQINCGGTDVPTLSVADDTGLIITGDALVAGNFAIGTGRVSGINQLDSGWIFLPNGCMDSPYVDINDDAGVIIRTNLHVMGTFTWENQVDPYHFSNTSYPEPGYTWSDSRLKENVVDTAIDYEKVLDALHVVEFNFIEDENKVNYLGLIAQELQEVLPERYQKGFIIETNTEEKYLALNESKLVYIALLTLKDQKKKIADLEARVKALENK